MTQLNIHMTPAFERDLLKFMKIRHLPTKAEAVRVAVRESLKYSVFQVKPTDFSKWVDLGNQVPTNKRRKFRSDKDIWES